jgi:hypothetical protein
MPKYPSAICPVWTRRIITAVLLALPAAGEGQVRLITDRPDFTESPFTVPVGSVQVEAGLTRSAGDGLTFVSGMDALVRWSPLPRFELRLQTPGYVDTGDGRGSTNLNVGGKWVLGTFQEWSVGAIASVEFPTGDPRVASDGFGSEVVLTGGRDVGASSSLGMQVAVSDGGGEGGMTLMSTLVAGRALTRRAAGFVEVAAERPPLGGAYALLHGGFTFSVRPTLQLDVHGAVGMTDGGPPRSLGLGFSTAFRVPARRPSHQPSTVRR